MYINKLTIPNAFAMFLIFISFFQFNITQILHYAWIVNAALIFIVCKDKRGSPWGVALAYILLAFSMSIHTVLIADYSDLKFAINQVAFLLSSSAIILLYSFSSDEQKELNFTWLKYAINISTVTIIGVLFFTGLKNDILIYDYNNAYSKLLDILYLHKGGLSYIFAWYLSFMFAKKISVTSIILLSLILVVGFGMRSLMLALVLFLIFHFIQKSYFGRKFIYLTVVVYFFIATFITIDTVDISHFDIRGLSLQLTLDMAKVFPFGIGLGGFDEFVILEPKDFTKSNYIDYINPETAFYNNKHMLTELPSDILLLTATFGTFLTSLYYLMIMRMVFFVYAIRLLLLNHERVILNVFIIYTFMGVGRHPIFTLSWWLVISMFVFVYIKYRNKIKILK